MPATATRAGARHRHPFDLQAYLTDRTAAVDRALDRFLPEATTRPATIHKAMRYSLFAGGKRMRPTLCLAAAEACSGWPDDSLPLACAVECIHTYSLIHDDLPAMDNDDYRRGKLTNHKVFGEGIAILAGDALLTQAFEIAAQCKGWPRYPHRDVLLEIARVAGSLQLIAGQDSNAFAKNFVIGQFAPPIIVVVHGRQVVVDERVSVDALDGAGQRHGLGLRAATGSGGCQAQGRAQALAAGK